MICFKLVGGAQDGEVITVPSFSMSCLILLPVESSGGRISIHVYSPRTGVCKHGKVVILKNDKGQFLADMERIDEL